MSRKTLFSPVIIPALALSLGALATAPLQPTPALARATGETGFADLVERVAPAVVNISTKQNPKKAKEEQQGQLPQFPPGSPFEDLFRDFMDRQGRGPQRPVVSLGSGFVIDPAGLIVTNNHVIQDADQITVRFTDGSELQAEILGKDPKVDLALLKVKAPKPLAAVPWGDSEKARVGDAVIAVGNPLGLSGSVTAGIISARHRELNGNYDDFIQTDAAINRGNSGGPLFNLAGEVIGINTAIASSGDGGSIGIGFSIPSQMARNVIDQLKQFGEIRRGWLGVSIGAVDKEMAEAIGLDKARGALVQGLTDAGPAAKAGVQPGDVIVKFDGRDIPESRALPRIVAETAIGKKTNLEVWRNGQSKTIAIEVGRFPDDNPKIASGDDRGEKGSGDGAAELAALGLKVAPLTTNLRQRFNIATEVRGLVVIDIDESKPAGERLRPGDVILEAGQKEVTSIQAIAERIRDYQKQEKKAIILRVQRNGGPPTFVAISLAKK